MPGKRANVKNEKQYEALKDKGMSKERAAKIGNSPGASSRGGKNSHSGNSRSARLREERRPRRKQPAGRAAKQQLVSTSDGAGGPGDSLQANGGGGNRTRVRSRTGQSFYRFSSPFDLARTAGV